MTASITAGKSTDTIESYFDSRLKSDRLLGKGRSASGRPEGP